MGSDSQKSRHPETLHLSATDPASSTGSTLTSSPTSVQGSEPMTSLLQRFGAMPLRKQFDSFTSQHKLRDAQEEFTQAVYRFRAAEEANAPNLIALKREMEFLSRKLEYCRRCVYTGLPVEEYAEWSVLPKRCPEPAWV